MPATAIFFGEAFGKAQHNIDLLESAVSTLNGANTVAGSVAKSIKDAIEALDVSSTTADTDTTTHVFVTSVTEADGKITVKTRALDASDIPVLDYISSTDEPDDVIETDDGTDPTYYSNATYIDIIKDLAARVAALENANS